MAVILSTWPFGIALGLFVQPALAGLFGWRAMMLLAAGACVLSLLLISICYDTPVADFDSTPQGGMATRRQRALPSWPTLAPVIVAGMIWGMFNGGLVVYFSFAPAFLAEHASLTIARSGALVSLALWVGMVSIPVGGYVAQRSNRQYAIVVLFCLIAVSALLMLVAGARPAFACVVLGLAIGPPPGVITALPTRILPAADRAAGFGVFYTLHYLFQATSPALAGWLHDAAGSNAAILFAAVLFAVPLPLLALFEFLVRRSSLVASPRPAAVR